MHKVVRLSRTVPMDGDLVGKFIINHDRHNQRQQADDRCQEQQRCGYHGFSSAFTSLNWASQSIISSKTEMLSS